MKHAIVRNCGCQACIVSIRHVSAVLKHSLNLFEALMWRARACRRCSYKCMRMFVSRNWWQSSSRRVPQRQGPQVHQRSQRWPCRSDSTACFVNNARMGMFHFLGSEGVHRLRGLFVQKCVYVRCEFCLFVPDLYALWITASLRLGVEEIAFFNFASMVAVIRL